MSFGLTSWQGRGKVSEKDFYDPFLMNSSERLPTDFKTALDLCPFLYYLNPSYRQASIRTYAHFVTNEFEYGNSIGSKREQDELTSYLTDGIDIFGKMREAGMDEACFGNSFWRINMPFNRVLVDRRFGYTEWAFGAFPPGSVTYHYKTMEYEVPDPRDMASGKPQKSWNKIKLPFKDSPAYDLNRINLRKMDPRQITLKHADASGRTGYIFRFDQDHVDDVRKGVLWQVNETPHDMLKAMSQDFDFDFNEDHVFHFKAPTISGVSNNGWGLPEVLANYRSLHQLQIYRKVDEAVGRDYMLPFRVFSPNLGTSAGDITNFVNLAAYKGSLENMIKNRRKDPYAMHVLPFPMHYEEASGTGKQLSPYEAVQYHTNDMLDAMGYPAELYRGSMQVQTIYPTMRIFENSFHYIYYNFNKFARWVTRRILQHLGREILTPTLRRPSLADDIEQRQVWLQLAASGQVSRGTALRPFGITDPVGEAKESIQEDMEIEQARIKAEEEFQRKQMAGTLGQEEVPAEGPAPAGGSSPYDTGAMGAPPGGGGNLTPMDNLARAEQEAINLLNMPIGERRTRMNQITATDEVFADLVKGRMEKIRSQGESAGRAQAGQMAAGG